MLKKATNGPIVPRRTGRRTKSQEKIARDRIDKLLNLARKSSHDKEKKHNKVDDQLTKTDRNGKFFSKFSNLVNWSTKSSNKITRPIMELLLKIDKEAELPKFYNQTLIDHVKKDESQGQLDQTTDKVVIFPTCFVNYNNPNLGLLTKKILNKLNIKVEFFYEGCCGMPQLEGGDIKSVADKAKITSETLSKYVDKGYKVLSIVPSCSLMLNTNGL